jgi:hypothetical protein
MVWQIAKIAVCDTRSRVLLGGKGVNIGGL